MRQGARVPATIDEYIEEFPEDVQSRLEKVRATIRKSAPTATEKISYRIPTFYLNGNLVHFAGYEHHIGFYPGARGISDFREELKQYKSGKGSVQFPHDEPLPLRLIAEITRFRVRQNSGKRARS
jgi:uncharacterized protein YdhG (YjbR/CyaY superfamily)